MQRFEDVGGLFHVYVTRKPPVDSSEEPWREKATGCPVEWARACQWVRSIMTMIGKESNKWFTDCEIEPAECPRPWTQEIHSAFDREQLRCSVESDPVIAEELAKGELMHLALCQSLGTYQGGKL